MKKVEISRVRLVSRNKVGTALFTADGREASFCHFLEGKKKQERNRDGIEVEGSFGESFSVIASFKNGVVDSAFKGTRFIASPAG